MMALLGCAAACLVSASAAFGQTQELAITFDDLPAHSTLPPGVTRQQVAAQIISALQAAGAPPITGFVNGERIAAHPETIQVLEMWRKAGNPLGNHTWSHMDLDTHTAQEFEADVLRNEPILAQEMGDQDWHWFRFPDLAEGTDPAKRSEIRSFLDAHHYRVAGVTANFSDYQWNEPYARCMAKGDAASVALLESTYLDAAAKELERGRVMGKTLFGHSIPLVLLLHVGPFDARMLSRLLAYYEANAVKLVTLKAAEAGEFYRVDTRMSADGPRNLETALMQRQMPVPRFLAPPAQLEGMCR